MKLENQFCTAEQGKRISEIVPDCAALFTHVRYDDNPFIVIPTGYYDGTAPEYKPYDSMGTIHEEYPAFGVAELGAMLPEILSINGNKYWIDYDKYNSNYLIRYADMPISREYEEDTLHRVSHPTEAKARAAMLIYLLENNLTTPTEVNTRLTA